MRCLHPARDLIGAYMLSWHSHRAALALREQVNDWQEDSGYPAYKPQVVSSSHQTLGSPRGWGRGSGGTHSSSPALSGTNSGRGNLCNARAAWGWPWQSPFVWQGRSSQEHPLPCTAPEISSLPSSCARQSTAELGRTAVLAMLEENKCPLLAALRSTASSGQLSISYRKNKWERGQKCPQAKQSNKRVRTGRFGPFSLAIIPSVSPFLPSHHHLTRPVLDLLGWWETGNVLAVPRTGPTIP